MRSQNRMTRKTDVWTDDLVVLAFFPPFFLFFPNTFSAVFNVYSAAAAAAVGSPRLRFF